MRNYFFGSRKRDPNGKASKQHADKDTPRVDTRKVSWALSFASSFGPGARFTGTKCPCEPVWVRTMKRVALVVYSHHGHTKKVAEVLARQFNSFGIEADIYNLSDGEEPDSKVIQKYSSVIIGGPVYYGEYPEQLLDWVAYHRELLLRTRLCFYSVGLHAVGRGIRSNKAAESTIDRFLYLTDVKAESTASFAGCLPYTKMKLIPRKLAACVAKLHKCPTDTTQDHELTDWDQVEQFGWAILGQQTPIKKLEYCSPQPLCSTLAA